MTVADARPSPRVVMQRVRNRLIEYFELTSSLDAQRTYAARAPIHVPTEVINQWEDWVDDPLSFSTPDGIFTTPELEAMRVFHDTWSATAAETPDPLPPLDVLQHDAAWRRLMDAAADALAVFALRGRLSESVEGAQKPLDCEDR